MKYSAVCGVVFPLGFMGGMTNNYLVNKRKDNFFIIGII